MVDGGTLGQQNTRMRLLNGEQTTEEQNSTLGSRLWGVCSGATGATEGSLERVGGTVDH
jgi:hypothetical protein